MSQQSVVEVAELHSPTNDATNDSTENESKPKHTPRSSIIETDFAELEDGSLVDLIEDPEDSSSALFVIFNGKKARYAHEFAYKSHLLVPVLRDGKIIREPRVQPI